MRTGGDATESNRSYDVAEGSASRVFVSADDSMFSTRVAMVETDQGNQAITLPRPISGAPVFGRSPDLHSLYIGEPGFGPNSLYKLDLLQESAPIVLEDDHGSIIDGEIVIATPRGLDFDALQLRLHPAASRVAKLAVELVHQVAAMGQDQNPAGPRGLDEADGGDRLAGARRMLEPESALRSRVLRRLLDRLLVGVRLVDPVLRLLLGDGSNGDGQDHRWCVVGDARQSIYGFRGATVEAFTELAREAEARQAHRTLAFNYRSSAELISFHNAFFPRLLTAGPHAETLAYVAQRAFRPAGPGSAVELLVPEENDLTTTDARELEARALAARIRAACDPADPDALSVWDREAKRWRPARYGDVVILMRKLTQVEPYRRALQAVGIETVVTGSGEFYGRQEVFDVLNALEERRRFTGRRLTAGLQRREGAWSRHVISCPRR